MFKEFKKFVSRGNVIDLAVGVIMGTAFSAIVKSLVDDIAMPLIGALIANIDVKNLTIKVAGVELGIGIFINNIIVFLIVSFVMFMIVKGFNKINDLNKKDDAKPITKKCQFCKTDIHLDATRCPNCTSELNKN